MVVICLNQALLLFDSLILFKGEAWGGMVAGAEEAHYNGSSVLLREP